MLSEGIQSAFKVLNRRSWKLIIVCSHNLQQMTYLRFATEKKEYVFWLSFRFNKIHDCVGKASNTAILSELSFMFWHSLDGIEGNCRKKTAIFSVVKSNQRRNYCTIMLNTDELTSCCFLVYSLKWTKPEKEFLQWYVLALTSICIWTDMF